MTRIGRIERSEIRVTSVGRVEVCWGGAGLVLGRCRGGVSGWVEEVGVGCVRGACVGRAWGVRLWQLVFV